MEKLPEMLNSSVKKNNSCLLEVALSFFDYHLALVKAMHTSLLKL